ncbi:MAG: methionine--tRNA ligase [Fusobacterium sp.]|uniref:methionine--tRNA ligase n=1 Tax=Fusobacterium sp. TaxID=68766 RepID=UPI0026DB87B3|nr:methionine--tRNA ligase [Fusobacterium sp.]MDO4690268.1 methionine--tRNA ligase [Fusobacterium sp.]
MCRECKNFYVTTPIYYVNGDPHVGTAYTTIAADVMNRYRKSMGDDTYFLTGTDEHGQKVEQTAAQKGYSPQAWTDYMVPNFKNMWSALDIKYDDFIRTTEERHKLAVRKILDVVNKKGDIYKGEYEGKYCISCETFFPENQLNGSNKCPDCGKDLSIVKEESYFFRMSKYADKLLQHIEKNPDFILPHSRRNEVVAFIKQGLQDLSISRNTFSWGIPIDFAPGHITYVWFDALTNYMTAVGYESNLEMFNKKWNNSRVVHLIGKDILRFHAIIWPCMLLSAGEKLPDSIVAHGWWTSEGEKMSKSKNNVVDPYKEIKKYGVDAFRYYLLREASFGSDGDYSTKSVINRLNSDLSNDLGNLLNRTLGMYKKYFSSVIATNGQDEELDKQIKKLFEEVLKEVEEHMYLFEYSKALESIWKFISRLNKYIDETMPWVLAKDEGKKQRLATVMNILAEALYKIAFMISPFMPGSAKKIYEQLGFEVKVEDLRIENIRQWNKFPSGHKLGEANPIFPRIEIEKEEDTNKKELKVANPIDIKEFSKVEIKVVEILDVDKVEGADKLLKFKIFDGEFERQIISGIAKYYPDFKKLIGKKVMAVTNLKFTKLKGELSQGMLLTTEDKNGVKLVFIDKDIQAGAIIK